MNNRRRHIKRTTFVRLADGRVIKRTERIIGFDPDDAEFEEIREETSIAGCGHRAEPTGWCVACGKSLCAQCASTTCWVCGSVVGKCCRVKFFKHIVCRRCQWRAWFQKFWREGF